MAGLLVAGLLTAAATGGCTVVSIEDDRMARAQQSDTFDAKAYADQTWAEKVLPTIDERARPLPELLTALSANADAAGKQFGRQAGEGSPYTYAVKGEGVVTAVDFDSPAGLVTVRAGNRDILLQAGPYVSGTALRDSLAFVSFNDFTNQIAFADVSRALNAKALASTEQTLDALRPGQTVRFTGVFAASDGAATPKLTAVRLDIAS